MEPELPQMTADEGQWACGIVERAVLVGQSRPHEHPVVWMGTPQREIGGLEGAEIQLIPDTTRATEPLTWWLFAHVKWQKANLKGQMSEVANAEPASLPFAF